MGAALLVVVIGYLVVSSRSVRATNTQNEVSDARLGGVRIRASHEVLEKVRASASLVGWTSSHYDEQGRLVLAPPSNYRSDDFGRLLASIDAYKHQIDGLQLLGPHGGTVDDEGVEHTDQR